jgi:colanic acid biosynthesis glycosyl transferase WcaI
MKILVISLYFHPDHTGIANYANGFAMSAQGQGHEVEVITGFSFYPNWKKRKQDRLTFFHTEKFNSIKIFRSYLYVPSKPNTIKRVIQEISFLVFATFGLIRVKKPDIIVCFTTPILLGFWSSLVSRIFRSKVVINVQDFQLEAALSLGMSKKSRITGILENIEKASYKRAHLVSSITKSMCEILIQKKGVAPKKVFLWPNWINSNEYDFTNVKKGLFRERYNIEKDATIVCYAGNIGLKQGLEVLIEMAGRIKLERKIIFLIAGNGAALKSLQLLSEEMELNNILFLPLLSSSEYRQLLNDIDIFVLPQKKTDFDVYFPSKLLGILACEVPLMLLADINSELYKTVESRGVGTCFEMDSVDNASDFVLNFRRNSKDIEEKVSNGVRFAKEFDEEKVISEALKSMQQ